MEKPPIIGPKVGPLNGPIDHMEKANARYSSLTMSFIEPGLLAIMALPAIAPKKRTTTTSGSEVASPQGMIRMVKSSRLAMYTGRRPYISEIGAVIFLQVSVLL